MMRLNYNIYLLILILAVLSCKKEPVREVLPPEIIRFSPVVETKSYVKDATDPTFRQNGFGVFGKKTHPVDGTIEFMQNIKVNYDAARTPQWDYDKLNGDIFWGLDCDHEFLGIYPYDSNVKQAESPDDLTAHSVFKGDTYTWYNVNTIDSNGGVTGTEVTKDLLYGRRTHHHAYGDVNKPVVLNMHHALTAISFSLTNVSTVKYISMPTLTISNLCSKATKVSVSRQSDQDPSIVTDENSRKTYTLSWPHEIPQLSPGVVHPIVPPFLVIPQDFTNVGEIKLHMEFQQTADTAPENFKKVDIFLERYPLDNGNANLRYTYLPGHHYHYQIDLTQDIITVNVRVMPWIDDPIIDLN